jgi:hypothetical protein
MSKQTGKKLLVWASASAVLLLVFAAYLQPEVVMTLANQIWFCL